jgi:hypothetical protein
LAFSRALSLALIAAASCGPIAATTVIDDAEVALARAHATDGAKYALYETTLADLYLMKAREEQGHARYTQAQELAADALKLAQAATRKAAEGRSSGTATPAPQATIKHAPEPAPPPAETSPKLPGEPATPPPKAP